MMMPYPDFVSSSSTPRRISAKTGLVSLGATTSTFMVRRVRRFWAVLLGVYPLRRTASITTSWVFFRTLSGSERTRLTVAVDTPASRATSAMRMSLTALQLFRLIQVTSGPRARYVTLFQGATTYLNFLLD